MPNIKAAEKWGRQSEKRHRRNLDAKTRVKTLFKKAKERGDEASVAQAESSLDRAARKGIIHPNKAARKKSRLAKAVNARNAAASAAPEPKALVAASARKKRAPAKSR